MIAAWMLYALLVAATLSAAGLVLERVPAALGRSRRWVWAGVMAASIGVPLAALAGIGASGGGAILLPGGAEHFLRAALEPLVVGGANGGDAAGGGAPGAGRVPGAGLLLLAGWGAASFILLGSLVRGHLRLARLRRRWRTPASGSFGSGAEAVSVRLSDEFGPAVVGMRRGEIVLPAWVFDLPPEERSLVLLHESEHVRRGDVRLLFTARLVPTLVPWLLPLWWQLHRLRLAIEIDCDARVLGRGVDASRYGRLLLEVGRRRGAPRSAVALAEPVSDLERRIRAMINGKIRRPRLQATVALLLGAALVAVACESPAPPADGDAASDADSETTAGEATAEAAQAADAAQPAYIPRDREPRLLNGEELSERIRAAYDEVRTEDDAGGDVTLFLFVDERGHVVNHRVQESSGREELDRAALEAIRSARFEPAENRGEPVGVWVLQRVEFRRS